VETLVEVSQRRRQDIDNLHPCDDRHQTSAFSQA